MNAKKRLQEEKDRLQEEKNRLQEEEKINIRKSYIFGMSGIITAIILAFLSNNIAFLANSIS